MSAIRECTRANWGSTHGQAFIHCTQGRRIQAQMPVQRPATIRHRTALFEDATAIVESEFGADLSLDDIAQRNVDKLRKRYPEGFDPERSRNRTD